MAVRDGSLLAVGDLHVEHPENREIVAQLEPAAENDWLIVCGDVAKLPDDIEWALRLLRERFATVIWAPGNRELLACEDDPPARRGGACRYRRLVEMCRELGVLTPEDPYPIWEGACGPVRVAPLFLLDEALLDPDPYPSLQAWCEARVRLTERRLAEVEPVLPAVLVNHFPLLMGSARVLPRPQLAQRRRTVKTGDWHRRFRATAVVHGHLHAPRTAWHDGVRFEEVSLGDPRDPHRRTGSLPLRRILPEALRG